MGVTGHAVHIYCSWRQSGTKLAHFTSTIESPLKKCPMVRTSSNLAIEYLKWKRWITSHAVYIGGAKVSNNIHRKCIATWSLFFFFLDFQKGSYDYSLCISNCGILFKWTINFKCYCDLVENPTLPLEYRIHLCYPCQDLLTH